MDMNDLPGFEADEEEEEMTEEEAAAYCAAWNAYAASERAATEGRN